MAGADPLGAALLENGVAGFEWYSVHDRAVGDGSTWVSDLGMLSSGECVGSICEPPAGTPFPPFYGMRLLNTVMQPGGQILPAQSSDQLVAVHAVHRRGHLVLLLINKSPTTTYTTQLQANGFPARSLRVVAYYDQSGATTSPNPCLSASQPLTLQPYSLTAVRVSRFPVRGCKL